MQESCFTVWKWDVESYHAAIWWRCLRVPARGVLSGDRVAVCGWGGSALKLDQVVSEVKESEEWEGVKMSILSVGIEKGNAEDMI